MSEFVISTRYADALMDSSEDKGTFEKVLSEIVIIKNTLDGSRELRNFLANPIISSDNKNKALKALFKDHVGHDVIMFLDFLIKKGRENLLSDICKRFIDMSNKKLNRAEVKILSAVELNDSQRNQLKSRLEKLLNITVIPIYDIDKGIIGGFKARVGDTIIDASIQHQLTILKKKLFENSYLNN